MVVFYIHQKSKLYKPSFISNTVENQNYDYIILGSSMGLTSIDTKLVDQMNSTSGLNASMDDTSLGTHYLMLKHFLESGGSTDKVFVTISPRDVANKNPKESTNDYRFLPYIYRDYVHKHFNEKLGPTHYLSLSYWQPFVGVSYYNLEMAASSAQALIQPNKRNRFDDKGNYSYPITGNPPKNELDEITLAWENPYLVKIESLAKENNIDLFYYQAPIYNLKVITLDPKKNLINHANKINDPSLFYDKIHVNALGREEITKIFANEISLE
ncbi:hypothetical protein GCM10010832_11010 [Psychroflexus planctonicus]|uniref:SGNH/GDSL hydrolase family protein n=1 Tax=Psychroflexus planctonicus TaxID=1526575 RepID=A0ABQ1SGJ8_9FLAO|nr:hypothetical protein GCM10010832_11010 [Psychroflexus planctonicus]